jgi:hypothetical protein
MHIHTVTPSQSGVWDDDGPGRQAPPLSIALLKQHTSGSSPNCRAVLPQQAHTQCMKKPAAQEAHRFIANHGTLPAVSARPAGCTAWHAMQSSSSSGSSGSSSGGGSGGAAAATGVAAAAALLTLYLIKALLHGHPPPRCQHPFHPARLFKRRQTGCEAGVPDMCMYRNRCWPFLAASASQHKAVHHSELWLASHEQCRTNAGSELSRASAARLFTGA